MENNEREWRLSFYVDRTADGWCVKQGGVIVAGPYGYRAIAHQEAQRLAAKGREDGMVDG